MTVYCYKQKTPNFTLYNVKLGVIIVIIFFNILSGAYETRTRDPMRDRHVF